MKLKDYKVKDYTSNQSWLSVNTNRGIDRDDQLAGISFSMRFGGCIVSCADGTTAISTGYIPISGNIIWPSPYQASCFILDVIHPRRASKA